LTENEPKKVRASQKKPHQISTIRAYIESSDEEDEWAISLHIKENTTEILAGKVEMDPRGWIYLDYNEDDDLIINNSPKMEKKKWDHITKEILDRDLEENNG
jgi:hypothetical protein